MTSVLHVLRSVMMPDTGTIPEQRQDCGGGEGDAAPAWLSAIGRVGCGAVVLTRLGAVRAMNAQGVAVLAAEAGFAQGGTAEGGATAVKALLARGSRLLNLQSDAWTAVARDGRRPLLIQVIPLRQESAEPGDVALILIDLDAPVQTNGHALMQVFGLTAAEARLTALLTDGASPSEAATAQGVSLATVRKHLVSIFGKTGTRGQVELVALASRLAGLP